MERYSFLSHFLLTTITIKDHCSTRINDVAKNETLNGRITLANAYWKHYEIVQRLFGKHTSVFFSSSHPHASVGRSGSRKHLTATSQEFECCKTGDMQTVFPVLCMFFIRVISTDVWAWGIQDTTSCVMLCCWRRERTWPLKCDPNIAHRLRAVSRVVTNQNPTEHA